MNETYSSYQKRVMKECVEDAKTVSDGVGLPIIYKVAIAMFTLRAKHSHYFGEEVKTTFKDTAGMTTDELALSAEDVKE